MSRYSVCHLDAEADRGRICALWARNLESGSTGHAANKLQQGYIDNPAANGCLFAVHEDTDAALAGVIGLHPRRFFLEGREWLAATLADFAVDQAHRSAGPALMLMRAALQTGRGQFPIILGIPNSRSHAICRRAGMSSLGTLTRYTCVNSSRGRLAKRINRHVLPVAAPLVDLALRGRLWWKGVSTGPALDCREASFDDMALDAIWARRPSSLLLSDRSASMLRWRYCAEDRLRWRVAILQDKGGDDCGYVVWRIEDGLATISDFFSTDPQRLTGALLHAHAQFVFAAGAHSVSASFLGPQWGEAAFLSAGYFLAETPGDRVLVANEMSFGELSLSQCYFTAYDNDD